MIKLKINCLFKKIFSVFIALSVAASMILSSGFSAFALLELATEAEVEAEIQYGLWYLSNLPDPSSEFGENELSEDKIESITKSRYFDKEGNCHEDPIDSKKVYDDIKIKVDELTEGKETCLEKAKAIYEWIFENVTYDGEGYSQKGNRDAIGVFHSKRAVCFGYANLASLMMRLAGVPCLTAASHNGLHSWNVVYLNDEENNRQGYTIFDSCWASCDFHNDVSQDQLKPEAVVYGDDDLEKFEYISKKNFPALDETLSLEDANRKIMAWPHHKMGTVRLGVMNDVYDFDYVVKKDGVEIVMHNDRKWLSDEEKQKMTDEEFAKMLDEERPFLTLNGWKEYDNDIVVSDDFLPAKLPAKLSCDDIFDAKKIVVSGSAKVIFPDASDTCFQIVEDKFTGLFPCDRNFSVREKLVQMREQIDFSGSELYEFIGEKLVEKADHGKVIFDFTKYDDLSNVGKEWEEANENLLQIYEKLGQELEKSEKIKDLKDIFQEGEESGEGAYHIFEELNKSSELLNKIETNEKDEDNKYINFLQGEYHKMEEKIAELKNKYNELLRKHALI